MPKKKWGQHFLKRDLYVNRMIQESQLTANDLVVEIGPGDGILTKALLAKAAHVFSIEIDPELQTKLEDRWGDNEKFTLIKRDILEIENEELIALYDEPFRVIANLPYNVASVIFFKLLEIREHLQSVTIMVQKEVAERLCATIQERKRYGVLSIAAELGFTRNFCFDIPPHEFSPPPKVDSAVVHMVPKPPVMSPERELKFLKWVQLLFQQRRKILVKNLKAAMPNQFEKHSTELTEQLGQRRGETLTLAEWIELYYRMHPNEEVSEDE